MRVGPNLMTGVLLRKEGRHTGEKTMGRRRQRWKGCIHEPRNAKANTRSKEARILPQSLQTKPALQTP